MICCALSPTIWRRWTELLSLDVPMIAAVIAEDATVDVDPPTVVLTPRPVCMDGVDNDRDGRVDLDDMTCAIDPNAATE